MKVFIHILFQTSVVYHIHLILDVITVMILQMELECQQANGMKENLHSGKVQEPLLDTLSING
jgi:hypothetical protein